MSNAHDDIQEGLAEAFNTLSDEFMPETVVKLLKQSATLNAFETVLEIEDNRFFEYLEYRQQFRLEVSQDDDVLTEAMQEATHIQINDDVYVIVTADTLPPIGTDVTWKIFATRFTQRGQHKSLY